MEALGSVWIALRASEPIGHAVLTVRYTMEHGGASGYIDDLFVQPGYRRQGVATMLLTELQKESLARGCRALIVEVGKDNRAALTARPMADIQVHKLRQRRSRDQWRPTVLRSQERFHTAPGNGRTQGLRS